MGLRGCLLGRSHSAEWGWHQRAVTVTLGCDGVQATTSTGPTPVGIATSVGLLRRGDPALGPRAGPRSHLLKGEQVGGGRLPPPPGLGAPGLLLLVLSPPVLGPGGSQDPGGFGLRAGPLLLVGRQATSCICGGSHRLRLQGTVKGRHRPPSAPSHEDVPVGAVTLSATCPSSSLAKPWA